MLETVVSLMTFLAGFFAVCALNFVASDIFERDRKEAKKRREELARIEQRERARERARESAVTGQSNSLGSLAATAAAETEKTNLLESFADYIDQSGVRWSPLKFIVLTVLLGGLVGGLLHVALSSYGIPVGAGVLFGLMPLMHVARKRRVRMDQLRGQLPDALELMSRIIRSGQTITQAMQSVASEFKAPIGTEFGYTYEQQNLGLAPELSLRGLTKRTGLLEMKILVLALLVHRQSGGNLAELLDKLARMIRERFRIRGKIRSLTAEGRLQAMMLVGLPPVMFLLLLVVNRDYAIKLFEHPELVAVTLGSTALGAFFIHKIVNFDF